MRVRGRREDRDVEGAGVSDREAAVGGGLALLRTGDRIRIEMLDGDGNTIFGAIDQKVVRYKPSA